MIGNFCLSDNQFTGGGMALSTALQTLATYLSGEFDNRQQAIADPAWFVHLKLWQRPVRLFDEDSVTLFAEQANVLQLEQPYRQRLLRLYQPNPPDASSLLLGQYYNLKQPTRFKGAGQDPERLLTLTEAEIELLPGCILQISQPQEQQFVATQPADCRCFFSYQGEQRQVRLGFVASPEEFFSYDTGIEIETGKAIWGAIMGAYRYTKRQEFSLYF